MKAVMNCQVSTDKMPYYLTIFGWILEVWEIKNLLKNVLMSNFQTNLKHRPVPWLTVHADLPSLHLNQRFGDG